MAAARPQRPPLRACALALILCWGCSAAAVKAPAGADPGGGGAPGTGISLGPPDAASGLGRDADSCARETHQAQRVPVDLLLLVDVSSSMANPVAGGTESKWQVAHAALLQFLGDPMSSGLNVGLQFFPLGQSCALADYQRLAVPFAELPAAFAPLSAALGAQNVRLNFGTPTGAAITGALAELNARLARDPGHRAVLLLVTDGEPTACTPLFIDEIAVPVTNARQMTPSIATYAIGVFTPAELTRAQDTVAKLAAAGGTKPFVLSAGLDLKKELGAALQEVRNVAVPCEFKLPMPAGEVLDHAKVNVTVQRQAPSGTAPGASPETLPYVADASKCDAVRGGWYYDRDPASGATPTRVVVCDSTCRTFKTEAAKVDLVFGCKTLTVD